MALYRLPSVPYGLAPLESSELGELLAATAAFVPPQPQDGEGANGALKTKGEQPMDQQGEPGAQHNSPRSCLEATGFSSKATTGNSAESFAAGAPEDWAGSSHMDEDEDHGSAQFDTSGAEDGGNTALRRSGRNHRTDSKRQQGNGEGKRKVGRPIIYCGDPDAPDLTPQERRRIRRRIANRESARRVRARRQDLLEDMAVKAREIEEFNAKLVSRAKDVEDKHRAMMAEVAAINENLRQKCIENEALQAELQHMKASLGAGGVASMLLPPQEGMTGHPGLPLMQQQGPPHHSNVVSSGFGGTPFGAMASLPPLADPCDPQFGGLAAARGGTMVPAVTTGQPGAGQGGLAMAAPSQGTLRAPSIEPAALTFSMDRSLSDFLKGVVCF